MRFIQDKDMWFKLGNLITNLLRLRDLIVAEHLHFALDRTPLVELTTPVNLGDGGADHDDLC